MVTLGNTPNTDVLCSNIEGTKFVHIQVKTFVPGNRTCSVGMKAEKDFGENFFWVLVGIPLSVSDSGFEYYIIPSCEISKNIREEHQAWLDRPGKKGQMHKDNPVRAVYLPPHKSTCGWEISKYRDRWDLLEQKLKT